MSTKRKLPKGLISKGLFYTAILSIRKEIKAIFLIAFLSIVLIEQFLKSVPAPFTFMITLGDIYLKLCYSLFASIIFLFINVQLPKEQKKLKSFVFVYNRITVLNIHLDFLVTRLGLDSNPKTILTKDMFIAAMQKIDPNSPVETLVDRSYKNWKEFIDFLKIETKNTLQELLPLHDNIDGSILESLFYIENIFHSFRLFNLAIFDSKDRWSFLATDFYNIWYHSNNCNAALRRQYKHTFKQHQEKHYREHILPYLKA